MLSLLHMAFVCSLNEAFLSGTEDAFFFTCFTLVFITKIKSRDPWRVFDITALASRELIP